MCRWWEPVRVPSVPVHVQPRGQLQAAPPHARAAAAAGAATAATAATSGGQKHPGVGQPPQPCPAVSIR